MCIEPEKTIRVVPDVCKCLCVHINLYIENPDLNRPINVANR